LIRKSALDLKTRAISLEAGPKRLSGHERAPAVSDAEPDSATAAFDGRRADLVLGHL
jgi:hypothetical protein